jgi:hypothetical protein
MRSIGLYRISTPDRIRAGGMPAKSGDFWGDPGEREG